MPSVNTPDGRVVYVPGVYDDEQVESSRPGPLPLFHVPVVLGWGWEGHPYDAADQQYAEEDPYTPFHYCGTAGEVARYFGAESELHRGAKFAWRHGFPGGWFVNLAAMVRASVIATSTGPINQVVISPKGWGPLGGWTKIALDATAHTLTVTPVKRYAVLSANLGATATRAYLYGKHPWLKEGAAVVVGANDVAGVSRTILKAGTERNAAGQPIQWVELSSAPGSACNTSEYAVILQYDDVDEVLEGITTAQQLLDVVNGVGGIPGSENLVAHKHASFTGANVLAQTEAAIKDAATWATATPGEAAEPTQTELDAFIAAAETWFGEFALANQAVPRAYWLISSDSDMHGSMRDFAVAQRTARWPISVMVGAAWGDHDVAANDNTNPNVRLAALNSQDVDVAFVGLDGEAPYLSMAGAAFGRLVEGGPGHNLTNDILIYESIEYLWKEQSSGELTSILKHGGGITPKLSIGQSILYRICQGTSSLQDNGGGVWNEVGDTTWSRHQRDLADFVSMVVRRDYESLAVGADEILEDSVRAILERRVEQSLKKRGYVVEFSILEVSRNEAGSGWFVDWSVSYKPLTDYITIRTRILI